MDVWPGNFCSQWNWGLALDFNERRLTCPRASPLLWDSIAHIGKEHDRADLLASMRHPARHFRRRHSPQPAGSIRVGALPQPACCSAECRTADAVFRALWPSRASRRIAARFSNSRASPAGQGCPHSTRHRSCEALGTLSIPGSGTAALLPAADGVAASVHIDVRPPAQTARPCPAFVRPAYWRRRVTPPRGLRAAACLGREERGLLGRQPPALRPPVGTEWREQSTNCAVGFGAGTIHGSGLVERGKDGNGVESGGGRCSGFWVCR